MSKPSFKNHHLYAAALTKKLVKGFEQNKDVIMSGQPDLDPARIVASQTMSEFNEAYVAKVFGYNSAKDLNVSGSSVHYLKDIKIPTLLINALNDPICESSTIPYEQVAKNPHLLQACTKYGGHLAYFEGLRPKPWLPKQLAQFIQAMVEWK
ncbi:hypothetical protein GGI20_004058 [Coemansia sp. BCRC 34301]|nr:hypothetical protein GGI20_004058 [Coemansia sp. BCRC 34301]